MFSIVLLVHAQRLTGSFAAAGLVTGAYAIAVGTGGPLLGHLVDRRGQTLVLLASAGAAALLLVAVAALPRGAPLVVLVALAAAIGLATPPVGACVRTLLPEAVGDAEALPAAYAFEASALELTFIFGPPLGLGLGALWSTGAALAIGGFVLLAATAAFVAQPGSRAWRPAAHDPGRRGGSLRAPAMQTLVTVLVAVGVLFGAVEVGVTAAAQAAGGMAGAGLLLAVWGAGSLAGGVAAARLGGGARGPAGLALVLVALTVGHLSLFAASRSILALAGVLFVAGAAIAPTYATVYAMVDDAAPAGTLTQSFAWLSTAIAAGTSIGAASAGALADSAGPESAFVLAGGAGVAAVLVTVLRAGTLGGQLAPARPAGTAAYHPA
jgi:predicted MFS family arabinose efflux permease